MKLKTALLAASIIALPGFASAEVTKSVTVGATSDYMFRGVSQNSQDPAIFGSFDVSSDKFYAGTFVENVNFGGDAEFEWDIYGGFKHSMGPVTIDLGALFYAYPQQNSLNLVEYKAAATYSAPADIAVTGSIFYSPEAGKNGPETKYYEVAVGAPLGDMKLGPMALSASASYGQMDYQNGFGSTDYANWKVGVAGTTENGWKAELAYVDTDVSSSSLYKSRGVFTVSRTF